MLDKIKDGASRPERIDIPPLEGKPLAPGISPAAGSARPPGENYLLRLRMRRWLIVLYGATVLLLHYLYGLPWEAAGLALTLFTIGAAALPREGLITFIRPGVSIAQEAQGAEPIAKTLIEALPEPAVTLSRGGTILAFNPKALDLFSGLKEGSHISSAIRNPQVLSAISKCSPDERERTVTFADRVPVERYMSATVSFLGMPKDGASPAILVFLRDLTEQRRIDQLRSDFIANASHEIRTPLTSIIGFIETLQGPARNDPDARDRFLGIMAKQAERMARLIDNLMSLSRVEMRAHLKPQDTIEISELVTQACNALEPMAAEAEIEIEINSEVKGARVLGDKDELTQVFINLLQNAIKYGKKGGHVGVTTARVEWGGTPYIAASIEDDGPGIASQHLPRITERFYRAPGALAFERGGTGLGLAIVKHVVNRHRGELQIGSEEGKGAKFTVLLAEHNPPQISA